MGANESPKRETLFVEEILPEEVLLCLKKVKREMHDKKVATELQYKGISLCVVYRMK